MSKTVAFIGGGNMSSAMLRGLVNSGHAATSIVVAEPDPATRNALSEAYSGIGLTGSNPEAVAGASIVILGVKPQVLGAVCLEIRTALQASRPLVVSIAAGVNSQTIDSWIGGGMPIVRVMPNQPALLGLGMSGLYANPRCSSEQLDAAVKLMSAVGRVVVVEREADIDTVTAVSGSGPAYFYLLVQILAEKAEALGLSADVARELAIQTAIGSAAVMRDNDADIDTLIARVRSPGGTTEAALAHLEHCGLRDIFAGALDAARLRAAALSRDAETNAK